MMITQAIVIPEPNCVELRQVELTAPGPGDVAIRTAYTSISAGTERMLLAGRMPHPLLSFPVVPGYETVGRVVWVGDQAPLELDGQWVYLGGARCFAGVNSAWGGQAATLVADHRRVVPLGPVEPRQGVLLALAATALHGIDLLDDEGRTTKDERRAAYPERGEGANGLAGRRVLVLGQGPVGQLAARLASTAGAHVIAADRIASRLAHAAAEQIVNADAGPLAELVGEPVAAIVEATGSMAALAEALPLLAPGGTILLLGYYDELRLPYMPLFLKQARLLTAREWAPGDLLRCRDMLADGRLDVAGLLTHALPIARLAEAYDTALNNAECLKLVLEWE